jgi:hypothetical protein
VPDMLVPSMIARISAPSSLCSKGIERRASGSRKALSALSVSFAVTVLCLWGLVRERDAEDCEKRLWWEKIALGRWVWDCVAAGQRGDVLKG